MKVRGFVYLQATQYASQDAVWQILHCQLADKLNPRKGNAPENEVNFVKDVHSDR